MNGRRRGGSGWMLLAGALLLALAGCATPTDPDRESDLPWNRQQAWEGQLLMPGSLMPGQQF
ncbi:MAG: hypothetical protein N2652_06305 [Kiritimatiellae bacterium]|nr:hypothetical protein [Kiritimatiellia bacterium]